METGKVEFQNVEQYYFPQSRVECHYILGPGHKWASTDWIGLFKVAWSSLKDYHTYVWAPTPQGCGEEMATHGCIYFQASYLPRSSTVPYQFVYVDGKGEVCARSSPFTFRSPRPLDDLAMLDGGRDGEDPGEDMLLVVPRADLLQSRLEGCLREISELRRAKEVAEMAERREREGTELARQEWQGLRLSLEADVRDLKEKLRRSKVEAERMRGEQKEVQSAREAVTTQMEGVLAESRQRIRQLEDDFRALTERGLERESELDRVKEQLRRMSDQRREEEEQKKRLEARLEQSDGQLQTLKASVAQREAEITSLRQSVTVLTHKLSTALSKEAEQEAALSEVGVLRERLDISERAVEGLRTELSRQSLQMDASQAELHQARLQVARLTLQLADSSLALREERAAHTRQREALCRTAEVEKERVREMSAEVQRKEEQLQKERMEKGKLEMEVEKEKDRHLVQLYEAHRELQELKACLRVAQKEQEQLLQEKQEMEAYMRQLEQRLEAIADAQWRDGPLGSSSRPDSPLSDHEDEDLEAPWSPNPIGSPGTSSLPDPPGKGLTPQPAVRRELSQQAVVISQPAPLSSPRQQRTDQLNHGSCSEREDLNMVQSGQSSMQKGVR